MRTTICVAENRPSCEPALKLLLLSLTAHSPSLEINLFYPPVTPAFFAWLKKCPQVRFQTGALANASGWNVKPVALMQMLQAGFEQVIWIDTDIVVKKDLIPLFAPVAEDAFVHHFGQGSFAKLVPEEYNRLFDANRRKFEEKWNSPWRAHQLRPGVLPPCDEARFQPEAFCSA